VGELGDKLRGVLEPALEPGESLRGACVATQAGLFKGRMVAIGVSDSRLILQGANRKWEADGAPTSLPPEAIAEAEAEGAGGGWVDIGSSIMDKAAVTLKLRTTEGEKLRLTMMRYTGPLGGPGGGEDQRSGIEALGAWFAEQGGPKREPG
jgi:hypothetical protein